MFKSVFSTILPYLRLTRLDRPIGTFLLLWPTLWALWLSGNGQPDPDTVFLFIVGVFVMRSAGCVINDFADRNMDPHVKRTRDRPLASGELSTRQALVTFVALLLIALIVVLQFNWLTIQLSLIGALLAAGYPFFKRFTHLPQAVLGLAFGWGILMAYAALNNMVPLEAWLLFIANSLWVIAYDTQYAMVDRDDDLKVGIRSTAILFAEHDNRIIGLLQIFTLLVLIIIGTGHNLNWHFYTACGLGAGIFAWQQYLCRDRQREACFQAFLNNNWFGGVVFAGVLLGLL